MKISQGTQVSIEFSLKLEDETVVGSNVGGDPVLVTIGAGEIFPAVEEALEGQETGATAKVPLSPEQAYGPVQTDAVQEVEKARIPEGAHHVGAELLAQDQEGVRARVVEVRDESLVLDFNHPLAGKNLIFDLEVLDVKNPPSEG
jgi:FKBP-type peptidyl-prolyl cis-trans isomerase 2